MDFGMQLSDLITGFVLQLLQLVFGLVATILTTVAESLLIPFG